MIRTVTIKQNRGEETLEVLFTSTAQEEEVSDSRVYSSLDFGVAQAIEDFLQTGEVSEYTN